MIDRIPLDEMTSDQHDALYARAEQAEAAVERVSNLRDVWADAPDPLARAMAADLATPLNGLAATEPTDT